MKTSLILLIALLAGCARMPHAVPPRVAPLLDDAAFAAPSEPVTTAHLFALSDDMRAYVRSPELTDLLRRKGMEKGLVAALYDKRQLKLEYDSTTTRTAAQTYAARSGNCLSLVIMTAAFAKELGMDVHYQSVEVDPAWSRTGALYMASSHVNVSLAKRHTGLMRNVVPTTLLTIDFLPPEDLVRYRTRQLEESDIEALFMNNRAAEALAQNRLDDAYWWARAAVRQPNAPAAAFNTLGVVYQRRGKLEHAEHAYRAALAQDPNGVTVLQNLVPLLAQVGKTDESKVLERRLASLDPSPPYHFFDQGMKALNSGDYRTARKLFEQEVQRAPYNDEFHFWLAIACLRLGETDSARQQLALAVDTSVRRDNRKAYAAKLERLRMLAAPGAMRQ